MLSNGENKPEQCVGIRKKQFTFKWQLKFIAMIIFTACLFLMKVIIGNVSKSMALVADSFHMITDFAALTIGYIALRLANSKTEKAKLASEKFTFGWIRAEVLGGLINTVFLFALCFSVFVSSLKRFVVPEEISNPMLVLVVGIISLVVNFVGLFLFRQSRDNICQCCFGRHRKKHECTYEKESLLTRTTSLETPAPQKSKKISLSLQPTPANLLTWQQEYQSPHSLNIRGVYLHILEHFLASLIVIITALISKFTNESWTKYVDPACTMIVVLMILHSTIPLFRETIILFMQSVPANIKVKDIEERLKRRIPSVLSVHEFHLWQLGGDRLIASAHILFKTPEDYKENLDIVKRFFQNEGIACMTFQPEFLPKERLEELQNAPVIATLFSNECFYACSSSEQCKALTCCGENNLNGNECEDHGETRPRQRQRQEFESGL